MIWDVFFRDREYAQMMGDPRLGSVEANSREEAEKLAQKFEANGAGVMVIPRWALKQEEQRRRLYG